MAGTCYRGKDLQVLFNAVDISGDGRSFNFDQSVDVLDCTTYGDDARSKTAGLTDGSGSFEGLDCSGDFTAAWNEIQPGATAAMAVYPEGNTPGNREFSFTAIINQRSVSFPYDDLATVSISFDISGEVVETTIP